MTPAVEARDLFRSTRPREGSAAQGLSLEVAEGRSLSSSARADPGKTTLLRIIAALDAPSAGLVRVHGVDLRRLRGRARDRFRAETIGYVDQHYSRLLAPGSRCGRSSSCRSLCGGAPMERGARRAAARARRSRRSGRRASVGALGWGAAACRALCRARPQPGSCSRMSRPASSTRRRRRASTRWSATSRASKGCDRADREPRHRLGRDRRPNDPGPRRPRERRGPPGEEALVVAPTGWVRLPEDLLDRSGIGSRARPELAGSAISLTSAGAQRARSR